MVILLISVKNRVKIYYNNEKEKEITMTERELEILELLRDDPQISQDELAFKLKITRSGVATHIHNLMKKGYIKGRGYIVNESKFVTVIGGNNIDILGIPFEKLIAHNSNPGTIYYTLGGAGRNIAYALTLLGVPSYFVSVYGDDLNGEKFISDCRENGIDTQCCEKIHGEHTSSFMYIDNSQGIKYIGISDMEIYKQMSPAFLSKFLERINCSQYCVVDTNLPEETFHFLYQKVKIPIIVKTVSINKNIRIIHSKQKLFALVTTPPELKELLNYYNKKYISIEDAIDYLLTKNITNIMVFSVSDGLYYGSKSQQYHIKKIPKNITNTNGACDVLTSVMIWGLQNEFSWNRIMRYGYCAIFLSLQTKEAIHPQLNGTTIVDMEKKLFPSN